MHFEVAKNLGDRLSQGAENPRERGAPWLVEAIPPKILSCPDSTLEIWACS